MHTIDIKSVSNIRDLGGIKTADGRQVAEKRLLRSGALNKLQRDDYEFLIDEYHLKKVVDMRTDSESKYSPDNIDGRMQLVHIPILDKRTLGVTFDKAADMLTMLTEGSKLLKETGGTSHRYMVRNYTKFVTEDFCLKAFESFFRLLLDTPEGAVLWHCSAGKDRAGTSALLLLLLLGVDRETAVNDYLFSNRCYVEFNRHMLKVLQQKGADDFTVEQAEGFLIVKKEYIDIVLSEVDRVGGIEKFAESRLHLGEQDIIRLRNMYLI